MLEYLKTQIKRVYGAFFYSLDGIKAALREDPAVLQWVVFSVLFVPLGIWLGTDGVERALLVASVLLILVMELINTAIEAVVDRISEERHPLSKKAKDVGSAVVLLTFVIAILVWGLVLFG